MLIFYVETADMSHETRSAIARLSPNEHIDTAREHCKRLGVSARVMTDAGMPAGSIDSAGVYRDKTGQSSSARA